MPRSGRSIIACPTACRSSRARSSSRRSDRASCSASRGKPSGCRPNEVADTRLRPLAGVLDVPPLAAPLRRLCEWTADYYLAPLASVLRMVLPSSAALEGSRQLTEYRPTGLVPDRLTPQREKALAALEGRQGTIRELADHAEVSDAVLRGLVNAGALEAVAVDADRPARLPRSRPSRRPISTTTSARRPQASPRPIGKGFDPVLLDGVTGSGKTEVYFEAIAECLRQGKQALVLLPEIALTEPFLKRFEARFGCAPVAWHSDLRSSQRRRAWRGHRQRRSGGHGRRPLGPVPALPEPRPDRRRRGARAELQAGGRRPVSRPRHGGDARQVRGHSGDPVDGDAADREPAHGRARPLSRGLAAAALRRRVAARHPRRST